ncbi:MAG: protein kinase [Polyangiaceae bacterium]|nr:protein kinase [Polyangiaceae bacterium]
MNEDHFGNFHIEAELGSGVISTTYKAVQEPLGRRVAIKALKAQIAETSSFAKQLDREAKILAALAHPNIVVLIDAARSSSGRPYLVLEYVAGWSLQELIAKKRRVSVVAALAIAIGICAGLEHAHERGVVHRDIKPSNVLLAASGAVKIIDFGIAQRAHIASLSDALDAESITPSGAIASDRGKDAFGTPAYMSPEQILGDFVDGRSDLFSLGVVLYEMLSGSRPFEAAPRTAAQSGFRPGGGGTSSAQRIRHDAPAPLRERTQSVPRPVERIVMRLLEKSPDNRYANAGVVIERLQAALRAVKRNDPSWLVRGALVEAGLLEDEGASKDANARPVEPIAAPMSLTRALVGYAAIFGFFAVSASAMEAFGGQVRENQREREAASVESSESSKVGGLRVVAVPWAHVRVDGELVETTPFARAIPLSVGRHFVTLSHPNAPTVEREVNVMEGETVMLDVTMQLAPDDGGTEGR